LDLSSIVAPDSISNTIAIKTWGESYKFILFYIKQQIEVLTILRRNNVRLFRAKLDCFANAIINVPSHRRLTLTLVSRSLK